MDKDPLLKLYEFYCEKIIESVKEESRKRYLPQIEELTDKVNALTLEQNRLISEINKAKQLLSQHNIIF